MAFGTAPVPLWPLYEQRDGFGATTVTVAFAILVVGASAGFVVLGHLSDHLGRRRVVVPALGVALVAALVLAFWTDLAGLLAGRLLNGVAIGLMASTATAYLHDLYRQEHPDRARSRLPGLVATTANLGGLALGPLIAGMIARWAPHPLTVTQVGFAAAMALCLVMAVSTPETVDRRAGAARPRRFALRPGAGALFGSASALGFFSFALFGLVSSLGAIILRSSLGISSPLVAGVAPFAMFIASAVAQLVLGRFGAAATAAVGTIAFPWGWAWRRCPCTSRRCGCSCSPCRWPEPEPERCSRPASRGPVRAPWTARGPGCWPCTSWPGTSAWDFRRSCSASW
ncbi:MFS transporter [Actinomadura yumaensis]|uniref:MFS transporter n=1 Tax=Actinomadura yumaensis TaxID=111807 RepID=UPI00360E2510